MIVLVKLTIPLHLLHTFRAEVPTSLPQKVTFQLWRKVTLLLWANMRRIECKVWIKRRGVSWLVPN